MAQTSSRRLRRLMSLRRGRVPFPLTSGALHAAEEFCIGLRRGVSSRSRQVFRYAEGDIPGGESSGKLQLPQQALQVRWRRSERPFRNRLTRDLPEGLDHGHEYPLVRFRRVSDGFVILWKNVEGDFNSVAMSEQPLRLIHCGAQVLGNQ